MKFLGPPGGATRSVKREGGKGGKPKTSESCKLEGDPKAVTQANGSRVCLLSCRVAASDTRNVSGKRLPVESGPAIGWLDAVSESRARHTRSQ